MIDRSLIHVATNIKHTYTDAEVFRIQTLPRNLHLNLKMYSCGLIKSLLCYILIFFKKEKKSFSVPKQTSTTVNCLTVSRVGLFKNVIIPTAPTTHTNNSSLLPQGHELEAYGGFSFRLRRLNNLCIIMCKKTANSSNWHLIFPSSPPVTEMNLNNLDSRAQTRRQISASQGKKKWRTGDTGGNDIYSLS